MLAGEQRVSQQGRERRRGGPPPSNAAGFRFGNLEAVSGGCKAGATRRSPPRRRKPGGAGQKSRKEATGVTGRGISLPAAALLQRLLPAPEAAPACGGSRTGGGAGRRRFRGLPGAFGACQRGLQRRREACQLQQTQRHAPCPALTWPRCLRLFLSCEARLRVSERDSRVQDRTQQTLAHRGDTHPRRHPATCPLAKRCERAAKRGTKWKLWFCTASRIHFC